MAKVFMAVFSQTGSTQSVAERIRTGLESGGNSVTLFKIGQDTLPDLGGFDVIGVGSPTFFFTLPFSVVGFIRSLPDLTGKSAFSFVTYGTTRGDSANHLRLMLLATGLKEFGTFACCGQDYWLGYITRGYLFSPDSPTGEELAAAEEFGKTVAARIEGEEFEGGELDPAPSFVYKLERHLTRPFYVKMYTKMFTANKKTCDGCGVCARKCPMNNIEMKDSRPKWGTDCLLCMSCELACPADAIKSAIDLPIFAPFMKYNVNHALKCNTPFARVEHKGGITARCEDTSESP